MKRKWGFFTIAAVLSVVLNCFMTLDVRAEQWEFSDGHYSIEVSLEGGSGRSAVVSPTDLFVRDGKPYARIIWNSSHYDYMLVEQQKYLPVQDQNQQEEHSVFEIPVTIFDAPMTVIGDTTAMSVPHEVEYALTFRSDSVKEFSQEDEPKADSRKVYALVEGAAVCLGLAVIVKRRGLKRK